MSTTLHSNGLANPPLPLLMYDRLSQSSCANRVSQTSAIAVTASSLQQGERRIAFANNRTSELRLPDFIGIGAMRSGSTTLWRLLDQHEQVFMPERKELHFFDNPEGNWERGVQEYLAHFDGAPAESVCGEFTPSYMFIEEASDRIEQVVPDVRLIAVLRDPVARAWSHYWYMVAWGDENLSFEEALAAEERRMAAGDLDSQFKYSYLARGLYYEQLIRFERRFSRGQLCVILFEDLIEKPVETMGVAFTHLGLSAINASTEVTMMRENSSRHPRLRGLHTRAKSILKSASGGNTLVHGAGRRLARTIIKANLASGTPRMSAAIREGLAKEFADSNRKLEDWLGRPLPWSSVQEFPVQRAASGGSRG